MTVFAICVLVFLLAGGVHTLNEAGSACKKWEDVVDGINNNFER